MNLLSFIFLLSFTAVSKESALDIARFLNSNHALQTDSVLCGEDFFGRPNPQSQHINFCLDTGPRLFQSYFDVLKQRGTTWSDPAILLSIGWTLVESGWQHGLRRPGNYCFWGFAKQESAVKCSDSKIMNDKRIQSDQEAFNKAINAWIDYMSLPHSEKGDELVMRENRCAPHRILVKKFEEKETKKLWNEDDLNRWLRSTNYAFTQKNTRELAYQRLKEHEKKYGITDYIMDDKKKFIEGEFPCTYKA